MATDKQHAIKFKQVYTTQIRKKTQHTKESTSYYSPNDTTIEKPQIPWSNNGHEDTKCMCAKVRQ